MFRRAFPIVLALVAACATAPREEQRKKREAPPPIAWTADSPAIELQVLNRVSWGANRSSDDEIARLGTGRWLDAQLNPGPARLPADIQARIDAMTITQRPIADLAADIERQRRALQKAAPEERKAERQAFNEELQRLVRSIPRTSSRST
jgi:hypothetical protein